MQDKVLSVFYGEDRLPYKDASRTTHYPIVNGNVFNGANNVTTIRYYIDRIGGATNVTWVVVSKLPNGQIANEVLNSNSAVLDSELGEHYIEFSISSYYTTIKGDLYLSLNGYQGGVEVEQDEDTGIYSIYGTPTIQATGSIKIGINYAPQILQGTHFNTSDLQQVLGALSDKANISDIILVVDNINSEDLSDYQNGQLIYDKNTKEYYVVSSGNAIYYDTGRFSNNTITGLETLSDLYTKYGNKTFSVVYNGEVLFIDIALLLGYAYFITAIGRNSIGKQWVGRGVANDTLSSILSSTPTKVYVDLDSTQTITGQKTFSGKAIFSDPNLYNAKLTTNSKNYFVRVGVTTGQYVDYNLPYNYSDKGAVSLTLATQDDIQDAIATFMQNEYQEVDTTTYPTLDDFLASIGEEGIIYLYPTGVNNDYYRYIYENSTWVNLGTTQMDLTNYVPKTTTIAGIDLQDNITSQELSDALTYATNTDIDNLF